MSGSSAKSPTVIAPRSAIAILALVAAALMSPVASGQDGPGAPMPLIPADPAPRLGIAPLPPAVEVAPLGEPATAFRDDPWSQSDRDQAAILVERLSGANATEGMRALVETAIARPAFSVQARGWDRLDRARIRALSLYGVEAPLARIAQNGLIPPDERSDSLLLADALFALDRIDLACSLVRERSRRWLDADWIQRLALCRFLAERRDEAIEALRALNGLDGGDQDLQLALNGLLERRAPANAWAIDGRDPTTGPLRAALKALGVAPRRQERSGPQRSPDGATLTLLDRAAAQGRAGDAAAIALLALEAAGPAETPGPTLERILGGLAASGWVSEAEVIARDAASGTPPS